MASAITQVQDDFGAAIDSLRDFYYVALLEAQLIRLSV